MEKNYKKKEFHQGKKALMKNQLTPPVKENSLLFLFIISFCFPVLLYLQTIKFEFSGFDDYLIILNNYAFLSDFGNVGQAFLKDAFIGNSESLYRPLQTLSYMVDIQLSGGNNVFMYHLSNLLLLGSIACLLFYLLKQLFIPQMLALLSTLVFCAHPLFVSSIAWIPSRGDLLLTFFALLSFVFLIELLNKRKIIYFFLHWASFTIALFCKETAAFLPFLFALYYFTYFYEDRIVNKNLFVVLIYVISGLFWFWLRFKAIGDFSHSTAVIGYPAFLLNLRTIPESLAKFFLPVDFEPIPYFSFFKTSLGILILLLLIILVLMNRGRSKKEKIFGVSWFLVLMLPPMLFKHPLIDYLDHRFFLPLIGIVILLLFALPEKWIRNKGKIISWLMIVILAVLSTLTVIKSRAYTDPITFFNTAIFQNPNSALAYYNRGAIKITRSDFQGALEDNDNAIAIYPDYEMAFVNRGIAKGNLGELHGAIADFNVAISLNKSDIDAYNNRGFAKQSIGNYKDAIDDYNISISISPNDSKAYNSKGGALAMTGKFSEALICFNKAIEKNPNYWDAYYNRSLAKHTLKDFFGAIQDCEKVLFLNPNNQNAIKLKAQCEQELNKSNHFVPERIH